MVTDVQLVAPIGRGFHYAIRVKVTGDELAFPAGCALKAEVRTFVGANAGLAGTLTTAGGEIVRVDDDTIELHFPGAVTAKLPNGSGAFDLVRTDLTPDAWMGVQVVLPVAQPVTAPDAGA